MIFVQLAPGATLEEWGFVRAFVQDDDPRPAAVQLDQRYHEFAGAHFTPQDKFKLGPNNALLYPGDPPLNPRSAIKLTGSDEWIVLYPYDYVAVIQPDGSFVAGRMD